MKIAVAGTGYVGLSMAVLLAQNHEVTAVDVIPEKVALLQKGRSPIRDKEIKEYLAGNLCRCTGYMGQLRAIQKYMEVRNTAVNITVKKMGGEE